MSKIPLLDIWQHCVDDVSAMNHIGVVPDSSFLHSKVGKHTYFFTQIPQEQVYRASFKVIEGDIYSMEMADPSTERFKIRARDYKERLNLLFRRSYLRHGFSGTEILALDGIEGKDLIVHFNVHIDPTYIDVDADDLKELLSKEISLEKSLYFRNLTIDAKSLEVKESDAPIHSTTTQKPTTLKPEPVTKLPDPPRKCSKAQLPYCNKLSHNITTYPNIFGHKSLNDVQNDMITFREIVDAECFNYAYDFVCSLLQPSCKIGVKEDEMVLPCKSFCRDFMQGCGSRLQPRIKSALDCNRFPEFEGVGSCIHKPNCLREIQSKTITSSRQCDGVADCEDLSDERLCPYCANGNVHCGIGRQCIRKSQRCDGKIDCPDGSDERSCLNLAPSVKNLTKNWLVSPHLTRYHSSGFVIFNEKGDVGKLCTENLNRSLNANKTIVVLQTVAASLCRTLSYKKVSTVHVETDTENGIPYVSMKDPTAAEISFIRGPCNSKQVMKITCDELACGTQATHSSSSSRLNKMAYQGDWPWHAALFKEDVHLCDGTLISPEWVITTTSCFQGQPKAEWIVRLGTIRLSASSPWQQERRVVGMVKSPVEGSTVALIRLEEPLVMSDFVRPICLPKENFGVKESLMYCNTLGWTKNRDQLQRVQVRIGRMDKCENKSISSVNSICTETAYGYDDCNEEEFAGSPLLCLQPNGPKWSLVGVSNWRIACMRTKVDRPRMYDKISSNVDWIEQTINTEDVIR
ncbi:transmembrane protease serine [Holotrichia oblita]|uniref:Transmembrane protease serine n=1 Tax=Holotrichia oblita TaxID=644536 RepID=A0ACB9T5S6_HOLOL|nr:transmembrane protease serine [Holotrichia oblita]